MRLPRSTRALALAWLAACSRFPPREGEGGAPPQAFTRFTGRSELFVEFPALVKDRESAFAVHLTRLADFKPVAEGRVAVVLTGGGGPEERFEVDHPTVPGIFRPVARPAHAGERSLDVVLTDPEGEDRHALGTVRVFASLVEAKRKAAQGEGKPGAAIPFLKEQQWKTEFATAPVEVRRLRASVAANGLVRARSDGDARVTAPVAGRLAVGARALAEMGSKVGRDDPIAVLCPLVRRETDLASLEQALARARLALDLARRERERLEALHAAEVVPERRVASARSDEQAAQADRKAAERRLEQHRHTQSAAGGCPDPVTVRAPLAGSVVEVRVAPGVVVEEGDEILRIVDLDRLWLEVRVPEAEIARVRHAVAASFRVPGFEREFPVGGTAGGRVVGLGGVLDAESRTVPLLFEVANPDGELRVGMSARVHVFTGKAVEAPAIPLSAVVDEGGKEVAYVQVEGEAFERRLLSLGVRDGDLVEVLAGLAPGERVVTQGAYEIRLAASSTSVPAHGHAH